MKSIAKRTNSAMMFVLVRGCTESSTRTTPCATVCFQSLLSAFLGDGDFFFVGGLVATQFITSPYKEINPSSY